MITELFNPWIRDLVPYSSARSEYSGSASVFLDANESWDGGNGGINRYPDPFMRKLRSEMERVMKIPFSMSAIGNGSDEIIDMLIRMFCAPGHDSVMIERPTYGTYSVFAHTSNVSVVDVPLTPSLDLDKEAMFRAIGEKNPKIVFICSPNNPTGRVYPIETILEIAEFNKGITVVDEAYADFARNFESAIPFIMGNPRIIVMRTFSKAYGKAGARLGILVSHPEIQRVFMKAKPPYNVSLCSQQEGLDALLHADAVRKRVEETISRRTEFSAFLSSLSYVETVFPSEANFILIRVPDAASLYDYLLSRGIVVRNRSNDPLLENTIRITIGSESEMNALKEALNAWNG